MAGKKLVAVAILYEIAACSWPLVTYCDVLDETEYVGSLSASETEIEIYFEIASICCVFLYVG